MMGDVSDDAWNYLTVCVPVVVIGAPLGSMIGSHFHRLVLAALIYILDTVALITAFIIVPQNLALTSVSVSIIVGGFIFFYVLTVIGERIMKGIPEDTPGEVHEGESQIDDDVVDDVVDDITEENLKIVAVEKCANGATPNTTYD